MLVKEYKQLKKSELTKPRAVTKLRYISVTKFFEFVTNCFCNSASPSHIGYVTTLFWLTFLYRKNVSKE